MSNAIKFTDRGGTVRISAAVDGAGNDARGRGQRHRHRRGGPAAHRPVRSSRRAAPTTGAPATAPGSGFRSSRGWCGCMAARSRSAAGLGEGTRITRCCTSRSRLSRRSSRPTSARQADELDNQAHAKRPCARAEGRRANGAPRDNDNRLVKKSAVIRPLGENGGGLTMTKRHSIVRRRRVHGWWQPCACCATSRRASIAGHRGHGRVPRSAVIVNGVYHPARPSSGADVRHQAAAGRRRRVDPIGSVQRPHARRDLSGPHDVATTPSPVRDRRRASAAASTWCAPATADARKIDRRLLAGHVTAIPSPAAALQPVHQAASAVSPRACRAAGAEPPPAPNAAPSAARQPSPGAGVQRALSEFQLQPSQPTGVMNGETTAHRGVPGHT